MPRDSSGSMTLPATNPVVADTDITTTWANGTMADLAAEVEDSLSRSGKGGMLVPFQNSSGTVSAPGVTFTSDTTSGVYLPAAGEIGIVADGTKVIDVVSTGATVDGTLDVTGTLGVTGVATFTAKPVLLAGITGITASDLPAANYTVSPSTSGFATSSASWTDVTNAVSTDFVATGRPIGFFLVDDGSGNECQITSTGTGTYFQEIGRAHV